VKSHFGGSSKDYFQGLPIPGAAGILVTFVLAYSMLEGEGGTRSIRVVMDQMPYVYAGIPFIMIALSLLMVSTAPYAAFKGNMIKPTSVKGLLLITAILSMILAYPQDALFLFFSLYALSGVIAGIYKAFRNILHPKET
ncbi:MAG: hypothetical protein M0011_08060, partial [Elusimicrobia bacterium]|nr:hypothetical protein [Elusimicrobiota bacterium]